MNKVTKYISYDGVEFDNESECVDYERFIHSVIDVRHILPECNPEGEEYYQHRSNDVREYRNRIAELCIEQYIKKELCDGFRTVNNILLRYLDDSASPKLKLIRGLATRCLCISNSHKEYEQPYYAIRENERQGGDDDGTD